MEKENLDAIMDAMNGTSIRECEITSKSGYLRIVREPAGQPVGKATVPAPVAAGSVEAAEPVEDVRDITSSWVGYFYRGAKKDDKPLLKLRDMVKSGQQVGIVITMNVVHQVLSELDGKITDFLVEDGQAVEYGQPLMRVAAE